MSKPAAHVRETERDDLLKKVREGGFEDLMDAVRENEKECFTKRGRLNRSGLVRVMALKGWKAADVEYAFKLIRQLLKREEE